MTSTRSLLSAAAVFVELMLFAGCAHVEPRLGSTPYKGGVAFRVWAPHADRVAVTGSFNNWTTSTLKRAADGYWSGRVRGAKVGDEYRYVIVNDKQPLPPPATRRDPRGRLVTKSDSATGNTIIYDPQAFDWRGEKFTRPSFNDLVIYQMSIPSACRKPGMRRGTFASAIERLDFVADLGVSAILVMPIAEYNTEKGPFLDNPYANSDPFAVEGTLGGPDGYKEFVRQCHLRGIAVHQDVVYGLWDHFMKKYSYGHHLRRFDGWHDDEFNEGIYYYPRARIAWTYGLHPNYGRPEVQQYILDNLSMWVDEYHMDGFRFDSVHALQDARNDTDPGWRLLQAANDQLHEKDKRIFTTAEDFLTPTSVTVPSARGGMAFDSRWSGWGANIRGIVAAKDDASRNLGLLRDLITGPPEIGPLDYTNFSMSAYEDSLWADIDPKNPLSWRARKLESLAAVFLLTQSGVPMIDHRQVLCHTGKGYDSSNEWGNLEKYPGVQRVYRDLIHLRRNLDGGSQGLKGPNVRVHHLDRDAKVIAYHRWDKGGAGDDVVVAANLTSATITACAIGFPHPGEWYARLNSDSKQYGADYGGFGSKLVTANGSARDGMSQSAVVSIAPYSALVFSQALPRTRSDANAAKASVRVRE